MKARSMLTALLVAAVPLISHADERRFTYLYEPIVLPENSYEFEQWITNQSHKRSGDYSEWNLRSEIEMGITSWYTSALYLNLDSIRSENRPGEEDEDETEFEGVSWENIVQLSNPELDPIGSALYAEVTTDGLDTELEGKILLGKTFGDFTLTANAVYEAEWEREDGQTEREATVEFLAGAAYALNKNWGVGLEVRNKSAYPDGLNLSGQEYQTWSAGPNLHYGNPKWWATLTALPQIWGNGDGSSGNRNLEHEEALEIRLIVGVFL